MSVVVITSTEPSETFAFIEGQGWHIDDSMTLHVRGESGNLAAFGPHRWASVYKDDRERVTKTWCGKCELVHERVVLGDNEQPRRNT